MVQLCIVYIKDNVPEVLSLSRVSWISFGALKRLNVEVPNFENENKQEWLPSTMKMVILSHLSTEGVYCYHVLVSIILRGLSGIMNHSTL